VRATQGAVESLLARVRFTVYGGTEVASVTGEVDLSNADDIAAIIDDRTDLRSIDSAGIRSFLALHHRITAQGGRLALAVGRATTVRRVLAVAGVLDVVSAFPFVNMAVAWSDDPRED
jgi:anti-anti-sigma factor